jgi:hypothetical protein
MNLIPSNIGANRKNVAALGVLVLVLIGVFIYNRSDSSTPVMTNPAPAVQPNPVPLRAPNTQAVSLERPRPRSARLEDFRPTLKLKEGTDVSKIDPTVKVELLAKLRDAEMKGGTRSVFAFGAPPPPPVDPIKVEAEKKLEAMKKEAALHPPPPKPPEPAKPPPPPPIPLKFFGYSTRGARKHAFFLDGDDVEVAAENEVIKNRYKVIRIGVNSVVVEDTQLKNQQTLPLIEELPG